MPVVGVAVEVSWTTAISANSKQIRRQLCPDTVEKVHCKSLESEFVACDFLIGKITKCGSLLSKEVKSDSKFFGQISAGRLFQQYLRTTEIESDF